MSPRAQSRGFTQYCHPDEGGTSLETPQNQQHKPLPQYCHPDEGGTPLETPQNRSHNIKTTREILPSSGRQVCE